MCVGGGGGGGARGAVAPYNFQMEIFGQQASNIRANTLDLGASDGENIRARDLSPPERNWSRICLWVEFQYELRPHGAEREAIQISKHRQLVVATDAHFPHFTQ